MNKAATWTAAIAALAVGGLVQAHHTGFMYEQTPIWIKGTVVRFERVNPHSIITLEDKSADGRVRRWAVEGPGQFELDRVAIPEGFPKVGDALEFCGFPYKEEYSARFRSQDADGTPRQLLAGHVMVTSDGQKEFWEPHGTISACILSSNYPKQSWLDFVKSNPRARHGWCEQRARASVQAAASLSELIGEIDAAIGNACR